MRMYIKSGYRAALMLLRRGSEDDIKRIEAIDAHHKAIASRVYNALMDGDADYAYINNGPRKIIYTRSLRGKFVQASYFCLINGDYEATMHSDITDIKKLQDTMIEGKYITLAA